MGESGCKGTKNINTFQTFSVKYLLNNESFRDYLQNKIIPLI